MTPEERQLIAGLFDRMRDYRLPEKDREAEALIDERVRTVPDASYMLVQSVLVQEQALQEAASRIAALEEQVRALESPHRPAGAGSFLGGLFGGGRPASEPARGSSVPVVGARATPSVYAGGQPVHPATPATTPAQAAPPPGPAAASGGGFLRTAMATAAGVAGGMLIAGAIRDLMSPAHAANPTNAAPDATGSGTANDTATAAAEPAPTQAVDENSSWFGGDGGDSDFEI